MTEVIDQATREQLRTAISENVRRLRLTKGLTQTQLAEAVGITYVQMNRLENGHHEPTALVLFALADALNVTADDLRKIPVRAA